MGWGQTPLPWAWIEHALPLTPPPLSMVDCKEAQNDAVIYSCQGEDHTVFCCYQDVKAGVGSDPPTMGLD